MDKLFAIIGGLFSIIGILIIIGIGSCCYEVFKQDSFLIHLSTYQNQFIQDDETNEYRKNHWYDRENNTIDFEMFVKSLEYNESDINKIESNLLNRNWPKFINYTFTLSNLRIKCNLNKVFTKYGEKQLNNSKRSLDEQECMYVLLFTFDNHFSDDVFNTIHDYY